MTHQPKPTSECPLQHHHDGDIARAQAARSRYRSNQPADTAPTTTLAGWRAGRLLSVAGRPVGREACAERLQRGYHTYTHHPVPQTDSARRVADFDRFDPEQKRRITPQRTITRPWVTVTPSCVSRRPRGRARAGRADRDATPADRADRIFSLRRRNGGARAVPRARFAEFKPFSHLHAFGVTESNRSAGGRRSGALARSRAALFRGVFRAYSFV